MPRKELKAYLAPKAQEANVSKWMPIETAPKDGTEILITRPRIGYVAKAHWEEKPGWAWKGETPCWAIYMCDDDYYSSYRPVDWPTHWRPLPPPPKDAK